MSPRIKVIVSVTFLLAIALMLGASAGKYLGKWQIAQKQKEFAKVVKSQMDLLDIGDTLGNHFFELIDDDSTWLKDLLSEKTLLVVVAPECPSCKDEAAELAASLKRNDDAKYFIFATWGNPRLAKDLFNEYDLAIPFLYDHKRVYFSQYDIKTFPFNLTLNRDGVVLDMLAGSMLKEDFEEIIEFNRTNSIAEN